MRVDGPRRCALSSPQDRCTRSRDGAAPVLCKTVSSIASSISAIAPAPGPWPFRIAWLVFFALRVARVPGAEGTAGRLVEARSIALALVGSFFGPGLLAAGAAGFETRCLALDGAGAAAVRTAASSAAAGGTS